MRKGNSSHRFWNDSPYDDRNKPNYPFPATQFMNESERYEHKKQEDEARTRLEIENETLKWQVADLRKELSVLMVKNDQLVQMALELAANAPPKHLWNAPEAYWAPEYQK